MTYEEKIRKILVKYPRIGNEIKVFNDQKISGCDSEFLENSDNYILVNSPEEAEYIPIWIDYKARCSDEHLAYINKFPEKCINVVHVIDSLNVDCDEITTDQTEHLVEMLSSPDGKCILLGLTMLRSFYLTPTLRRLALTIIDTVRTDCMNNVIYITPLNSDTETTIENLTLIQFYYMWLHNKLFKI